MTLTLPATSFREDILRKIRMMADNARPLGEMVELVQKELGISKDLMVPVLGYFCQAFSMRLYDVLPLRDWAGNEDDPKIVAMLAEIRKAALLR